MNTKHVASIKTGLVAALVFLPDLALAYQETGTLPFGRQGEGNSITIGESFTIHSSSLNEDRDILLYLPDNYVQSDGRYPVVYLLDGNFFFLSTAGLVEFLSNINDAPKMIVAAIVSPDRMHDLSTSPGGGAAEFTAFLKEELLPYMDVNYRTEPYRIFIGHSLGGHFVVHTLLNEPELFDAYIAASPALFWNGGSEVIRAGDLLSSQSTLKKFLYLTYSGGDGNNIRSATDNLVKALQGNSPNGFRWEFTFLPNDRHNSAPIRSVHGGLELLFSGWAYRGEDDAEQMEDHYRVLSEGFGFECKPTEDAVASRGRNLARRNKIQEAIELYHYNARLYPDSPDVYESLGDLYLRNGDKELAIDNFERSLRLNPENPAVLEVLRGLRVG